MHEHVNYTCHDLMHDKRKPYLYILVIHKHKKHVINHTFMKEYFKQQHPHFHGDMTMTMTNTMHMQQEFKDD